MLFPDRAYMIETTWECGWRCPDSVYSPLRFTPKRYHRFWDNQGRPQKLSPELNRTKSLRDYVFVDEDGVPLETTTRAPSSATVSAAGTGRFDIRARRALLARSPAAVFASQGWLDGELTFLMFLTLTLYHGAVRSGRPLDSHSAR